MISDNELLRRAVRWISAERVENPNKKINELLDEAGKRFNLSPIQTDSLLRILKEEQK